MPDGSLALGEGSEVGGAGGGGHPAIEARARGPHAHPHAAGLEAHGRVEAVGDRVGAHHGAGGGEGGDGGALHGGGERRVAQGQAGQRRHAVEQAARQILRLRRKKENTGRASSERAAAVADAAVSRRYLCVGGAGRSDTLRRQRLLVPQLGCLLLLLSQSLLLLQSQGHLGRKRRRTNWIHAEWTKKVKMCVFEVRDCFHTLFGCGAADPFSFPLTPELPNISSI